MKRAALMVFVITGLMLVAYEGKANYEPKVKTTKDTDWEIAANYPKFEGKKMADANKAIKEAVDSFYNDWETFFTTEYTRVEPDGRGAAEMTYQVFYADTDAVSILFETMEYSGGAHPNHRCISFNYNVLESKRATIDDLWVTELLPQIADYCERDIARQLKEKGVKDALVEEIEPVTDNFKTFNASWKALYFTFESGFVTANYLGSFTVEMPMETLMAMEE